MVDINHRKIVTSVALGGLAGMSGAAFAQARPAEFKFKLGTDLPVSHSVNVRLKEAIAAIAVETQGRVAIQLFPNNQLGSDTDMLSQIRSGALELATFPGTVMSTLIPVTAIAGVGFAFPSYDKVWTAMDGALGNHIRRGIEKMHLVPFDTIFDNGYRHITSSIKPIQTPNDLKGFKIRVPLVPLWVSMFKTLGAAPVSLPLSEAYQALQTKVADGQENPLTLIDSAKFYEIQKYCSLSNHSWDGFWFVASERIWKGVPDDIKKVMTKHINAAARLQRDDTARANVDIQQALEAKGLVFNKVNSEPFRKILRTSGFYSQVRERFGPEAWGLLTQYAGDIA